MPRKAANPAHRKQPRFIFEGKPPAGLTVGTDLSIMDPIRSGDLVRFRRNRDGQLACRLMNDSQLSRARGPVFLVSQARGTVRFRRLGDAPPAFGDFPFAAFTAWMQAHFMRAAETIMERRDQYAAAADHAGLEVFEVPDSHAAMAADVAYLAILALALNHSLGQDALDGHIPPIARMSDEPFRRARAMLQYHADRLPVQVDEDGVPALLDERAACVAFALLPVTAFGFETPSPVVGEITEQLPRPLIQTWKKHEHRDDPLCHLMVLSFFLAFRGFIPGKDTRYWQPIIDTYWFEWTDVLLDVRYGIITGDISPADDEE